MSPCGLSRSSRVPSARGIDRLTIPSASSLGLASPSVRRQPPWTRIDPPLVGFTRVVPSSVPVPGASTPGRCRHPPSARRYRRHVPFRPRGFSPPRRLAPLQGSRRVAAWFGWGSLRFTACPSPQSLRSTRRPRAPTGASGWTPFPATRFIPLEAFPSSAAVPHHCGRCPPAVPSPLRLGCTEVLPARRARGADPRSPARPEGRWADTVRARRGGLFRPTRGRSPMSIRVASRSQPADPIRASSEGEA